MTQYIYVPFAQNNLPKAYDSLIEEWKILEPKSIICYAGTKALNQLQTNAQISILVSGTPGRPPAMSNIMHVPTETLRHTPGLSKNLRIKMGEKIILGPETADQMITDGLLEQFKGQVTIRLLFIDDTKPRTVVKAFFNALKADERHANGSIRIECYPARPARPTHNSIVRNDTTKSKITLFKMQMAQNNFSMYNKLEVYPKLSLDEVALAIKEYLKYKSSRCCGLSGLLGLNGLFTSNATYVAIKILKNSGTTEYDRFHYATQFLTRNKNSHFAKVLRPYVDALKLSHESQWAHEPTQSLTLV